jgi:hypothetical protein
MATVLRLEPESAALSIKRRVELIDQCAQYIRETVARYDGLKSFEAELEKHGIKDRVASMTTPAPAPEVN